MGRRAPANRTWQRLLFEMNRRLFWKLCLIIATGVVALFYCIDLAVTRTEADMSLLDLEHREQLRTWGKQAQDLYQQGDLERLNTWLNDLQKKENTWVAVANANVQHIAGDDLGGRYYRGYNLGRDVDWKVHLYFKENPVMELPFSEVKASLLVQLPDRMRPGSYWQYVRIVLQVILPMMLLALLSVVLYRHIMSPLRQLQKATRAFSLGNFDVRVRELLGNREDELSELASTFDQMAGRIGELIIDQRQLIADLSHELRTPLARLDIAVESLHKQQDRHSNIERIQRESQHIRQLVDDTLTLAWLGNERPKLRQESLDLVDLLDVLIADARFEFSDKTIRSELPNTAHIDHSNHRALGQALENILRNAMRYTPTEKMVSINLSMIENNYHVAICDQGSGVPEKYLSSIFKPFFRVDSSRLASGRGFGLGLALARRQLEAVGGTVSAQNRVEGGLEISVILPQNNT